MIIINGKPIFNCLDFYENVDINQLLLQKAEFYNFALRHMQFDKVNKACINVLKEACENPGSLKMCNERVFWYIGNQEIDGSIIREKNILLSYAFEKFEGLSVSDRFFIGAVLLLCPNAYEVMDKMSESVTNEEGFLSFQGDGDEYILSAGERFSARINPALKIEDGEEMKVWKLKAFGNAQRGAVITACDQSGAEFEVFPGIIQYVLACRGQIVNVLDNSSCDKDNKLYRGKNCIYDKDGSSTDVPYDCISFAPWGKSALYITLSGKIAYTGDGNLRHMIAGVKKFDDLAQVMSIGNNYYVLRRNGEVWSIDGVRKGNGRFTSLTGYKEMMKNV